MYNGRFIPHCNDFFPSQMLLINKNMANCHSRSQLCKPSTSETERGKEMASIDKIKNSYFRITKQKRIRKN
jgi:hypothetical protein